jgi:threonine aldolase
MPGVKIDPAKVRTNILIFDCSGTGRTAVELCEELHAHGVGAQDTATYAVRFVTHCDVDEAGIETALVKLQDILRKKKGRGA